MSDNARDPRYQPDWLSRAVVEGGMPPELEAVAQEIERFLEGPAKEGRTFGGRYEYEERLYGEEGIRYCQALGLMSIVNAENLRPERVFSSSDRVDIYRAAASAFILGAAYMQSVIREREIADELSRS